MTKTGELLHATMKHDGLERIYDFYLPTGYGKEKKLPLMLMLHGMGSNSDGQLRNSEVQEKAEAENFILVAPNSSRIDAAGNIFCDAKSAYDDPENIQTVDVAWNAGHPCKAQQANVDDVGYISALIDYFIAEYGVNPNQVYAVGQSNGGMFSHKLALELSHKLAAISSVLGPLGILMKDTVVKEPLKVMIMVSDKDPVIDYNGVNHAEFLQGGLLSCPDTVEFWKKQLNITGEPETEPLPVKDPADPTRIVRYRYPKNGKGELVLYVVEGAGHTWPGGLQYLPEEVIGLVSSQAKGIDIVWEELKGVSK